MIELLEFNKNKKMKQPKIILISGPSGVGKGTLIKRLKERHKEWVFPISCTTRAPRN